MAVGEEVRHVNCGQTAACFVPGEWTIQRAERHTPEAHEGLLPRCRYINRKLNKKVLSSVAIMLIFFHRNELPKEYIFAEVRV